MRSAPATPRKPLPTLAGTVCGQRWAELTAKLLELETQQSHLLADGDVIAEAAASTYAPFAGAKRPSGPQPDPLSPAARAALGALAPPPPGPLPGPDLTRESAFTSVSDVMGRAADIKVQVMGVRQAIDVIHSELGHEHPRASREYCAAVALDAYRPIAAQVCEALVALGGAVRSLNQVKAEIVAAGANPVFLPLLDTGGSGLQAFVGDLQSGASPLIHVLNSAREGGHFDASRQLAEWRSAAPAPAPAPMFAAELAALRAAEKERIDRPLLSRLRYKFNQRLNRMTLAPPQTPDAATILGAPQGAER